MYFDCIAELIADRIGCKTEDISKESRFSDLGIDSLDTMELLMELEDRTGIKVELTEKSKPWANWRWSLKTQRSSKACIPTYVGCWG